MMRFSREARQKKAVLEALAMVGDAGMTPLTLALTTELPEHRLQEILQRLIDTGVVTRRVDCQAAGARIGRSRYRLELPRQRT
jgi:hypothetical protein